MRQFLTKLVARLGDNRGALNVGESLALKAVSLLLALILWITILGFKKEQIRKDVKFEPLFAPNMVVMNKIPESIQFTLRGPRVQLQEFVKKITPHREDLRNRPDNIIPIQVDPEILGELPSGIEVVTFHPASFEIRLEQLIEKEIVVRPSLEGLPQDGYEVATQTVAPKRVLVAGPKSLVEAMDFVDTEPIAIQDLDQSVEGVYSVEVDTSQGFRLSRDRVVRVELEIRKIRDRKERRRR